MAGPVLAWFFVQGAVSGAWSAMRREVEMEVPTFLLRMSGTAQVQPNVQRALEEVEPTLNPNGSLRKWIHRFAARLQAGGRPALKEMLDEAEAISPSLGLAVFEIGRLWEAGGAGYPRALAQAAENLGFILDGRAQADAKAAGAKRAMLVVLGALLIVTGVMMRNPTISASIRSPVIQVMYLLIAVWVAIGWAQVNSMIEEAVT
jgi:predicted phage tail protein